MGIFNTISWHLHTPRTRIVPFVFTMTMALLASCDIIDVHPYDGKIDSDLNTDINAANISRIESTMAGRTQIRFAVISDTQRWYDETEDMVDNINARGDIDFVIHCGDLTDFGATKEFELQQRILDRLRMPYVVLLGNHDCIGSGKAVFRTMFGLENFSFVAGHTRFICLDTNALEYDFKSSVPDIQYLASFIGDTQSANTVTVMHSGPFSEQFNNNVAKYFEEEIMRLNSPLCCIHGHGHSTEQHEPFNDGMIYYQVTCAKYRQYYVFNINENGYSYETIDY